MKTAIVISDTHGNRQIFDKLKDVMEESDYIIHLGDTSGDGQELKKLYPEKTFVLNGNCDMMRVGEDELIIELEEVKIFACHGDRYRVKATLERLAEVAAQNGCSVALYGHTHTPAENELGGVKLFNPGCSARFYRNTYLYLVVNGKTATGKIVTVR